MPFGYVDWKKNCSTSRSSCYGWRIRNPNRRSSAIGFAPVLTAGIFLPRAVAITMAARIDGFTFGLTASTGVRTVTVAGAGCVALVVQHPCMAAAGRAGPGPIAAVAVLLVNVSAKIFYIMALITLVVLLMTSG